MQLALFNKQSNGFQLNRASIRQSFLRYGIPQGVFLNESKLEKDLKSVVALYPDPKLFLQEINRPKNSGKSLQPGRKKLPDLAVYREAVSQSATGSNTTRIRNEVARLIKKHGDHPEIKALRAIQIFNDISHSGLDQGKLTAYKNALLLMTDALYNGGTNIFNATWFVKIYLKFLDALSKRMQSLCKSGLKNQELRIRILAKDVKKRHMQVALLMNIQDKLDGLQKLNQKMRNTVFFTEGITNLEIRKAYRAIADKKSEKLVGKGKKAIHVIWVSLTLNLLFSKIPILNGLVEKEFTGITDSNREFCLQKSMLHSNHQLTDFRLAMAEGDRASARTIALKLYKFNDKLIDQHLSMGIISKASELDPYLKKVWIVNESRGLFKNPEYQNMVSDALNCIRVTMSERCQIKGLVELAEKLRASLMDISLANGWA